MQKPKPATPNIAILPQEMPNALERADDGIKVLSLDCFDTLLWRDCHAPSDLFTALPQLSVGQRMSSEQNARKAETTLKKRNEVAIEAIYEQALPNATGVERANAIEAELDTEAASCFAFGPTVELMRKAKAAGLKVIIVSDTYLSVRQLRKLIEKAAGDEVVGLIDRFFVSSEAGISKSQGLLQKVLKTCKVRPQEVLHIGDNRKADLEASRALGVPALHLVQFSDTASQRLRYERACHQLIGDVREDVRALMPHRAVLACEEPKATGQTSALGLNVLGPVFYAFDQWLRKESKALQNEHGGTVHWLFMLRDGHLPHIIHEALGAEDSTALVEISRFVSIAASLTTREAYTQYYSTELGRKPSTLARQMLFTEEEITHIVGEDKTQEQMLEGSYKLAAELKKGQRQKIISRRAKERAERLIEHVRSRVNPTAGDTLMLVDLGYNGSAQSHVDQLLSDAFNCHVAGRYLILRELTATGLDKKGLIDQRHYDLELIEALCGNVAVIEQLATCELGSVVDFTPKGEPIREETGIKGGQSDVRNRVQAGAVRYAKAAEAGIEIRGKSPHRNRALREGALGALSRFMFLPHASELKVLTNFEHDVNMGSERKVPLFDAAHAKEGMRRRGLFYMQGSARMFLPAELENEDIHTRLSLLVQKRFGLGLRYSDTSQTSIAIPAFFVGASDSAQTVVQAHPTHEGYYSVRVPVPKDALNIGLGVGSVFEWFELKSISAASVDTLRGGLANDERADELGAQFDGLKVHAPGIHECTGSAAFVLVKVPQGGKGDASKMIEIVLRPLIRRRSPVIEPVPVVPTPSARSVQQEEHAA
ncbi:HAD family hydrolase [uncultured Erythrobacter sp.]|uniref:HAD family hydrolase n=1 Tax=uncultured Erythrobacter sp. TaxID=263913 RepID=UPI00262C9D62|nr:HAD family hydrolase [uncultured Erythrobacter sp.]